MAAMFSAVSLLTFLFCLQDFGGGVFPIKDEPVEAQLVVERLLGILQQEETNRKNK